MGENLKKVIERVLDGLSRGEGVDSDDWEMLERAYAKALNNAKCPCENGKNFSQCCKKDWMMLKRLQAKSKTEVKEEKKQEAKEFKGESPLIALYQDKSGGMKIESSDNLDPMMAARLLLTAYHEVMCNVNIMMMNNTKTLIQKLMGQRNGPSIIGK
jgi:hypothetical protein